MSSPPLDSAVPAPSDRVFASATARAWTVVGTLIAVSIAGRIWFGRSVPTPWISPDEVIYALLGRTLYADGRLAILNAHSDFYSLVYPALIGSPLAWLGSGRGYAVAKAIGAVAMSLAAVPMYVWARSLVGARSAVLVAGLTLALPALTYSGFLMTETAFYPLLALAAWTMARTIVRPTPRRQALLVGLVALAALTRLQAIVLVVVFPTAVLLSRTSLRRYAGVFGGFAALVGVWAIWRLVHGGAALGAYTEVASGGYHVGTAVRFVFYHLGDVVLMTGFLPAGAAALLWFERRRLTAEARATLAVTTALTIWLVLQVGVFASRYVGHLAERDLIAAAPPLFLCLVLWLELGAPRTRRRVAIVGLAGAACVFAWPLHTLLKPDALPDSPTVAALYRAVGTAPLGQQQLLIDGGVAVAAILLALAPLRLLRLTPLLLVALLALESVAAADSTSAAAGRIRDTLVGPTPGWVDKATTAPVTMLYSEAEEWNVVWETLFWNRRVQHVYALPGAEVIGPAPGGRATLAPDGTLRRKGSPVVSSYTLAPAAVQVVGKRVADAGYGLAGVPVGLSLWRTEGPLRVVGHTTGLQPNGDIYESATMNALGCPGTMELTLVSKQQEAISLYRDGRFWRTVRASPPQVIHLSIPSRPGVRGRCAFGVTTTGLLGTTQFEFRPAS
jgi:Dolichyl-phosphate-mannose-protein mannosyltransferase